MPARGGLGGGLVLARFLEQALAQLRAIDDLVRDLLLEAKAADLRDLLRDRVGAREQRASGSAAACRHAHWSHGRAEREHDHE